MELRTLHHLSSVVRGRRRALKLSQSALGVKAGVSRAFIADLEAGKTNVQMRGMLAVLEALGLRLSLDIEQDTSPTEGSVSDSVATDFDLAEFLRAYDESPPLNVASI